MAKKNTTRNSANIFIRILIGLVIITLSIYLSWILHKGANINPDLLSKELGYIGFFLYRLTHSLTGQVLWPIPIGLFFVGLNRAVPRFSPKWNQVFAGVGIVLLILAWKHSVIDISESFAYGKDGIGGGLVGAVVSYLMIKLFGATGTRILIVLLTMVLLFIGTEGKLLIWMRSAFESSKPKAKTFGKQFKQFVFVDEEPEKVDGKKTKKRKNLLHRFYKPKKEENNKEKKGLKQNYKKKKPSIKVEDDSPTIFIENIKDFNEEIVAQDKKEKVKQYIEGGFADAAAIGTTSKDRIYHLPNLELLDDISKKGLKIDQAEIDHNAGKLEQTLADFGVKGQITEVSVGPTVTEYEFQPAPGVKVSKITNLSDDLALSLATSGVRIEAPIPGKAAVGIEVPNKRARVVRIKEILSSEAFQTAESKTTVALGKDIAGRSMVTDLAKMPHLLIAGATGSGKSVCLNALILSILFKAKPYEVKFLMIDPKMVELGMYNGIPHLLAPVVTDSNKAAGTLRWAVKEMEKRYEQFASNGVKDIRRYNQKCLERQALGEYSSETELMPHIVIIIDELADLMMVAPADVEDSICRLAQMARAAGMYLVIATQRPSVDVITGLIKANIPSRIAFAVSSQVDSRTILDMGGAEKLLGRGDMLFYPTGIAKPKRIQNVFVSDDEIDAVVEDIKKKAKPSYNDEVLAVDIGNEESHKEDSNKDYDELIPDVCLLFIENGQASISMLQRHFRIGYTRAARIIDQLEELGYVGPYEGSKPRQIKMTLEEHKRLFG